MPKKKKEEPQMAPVEPEDIPVEAEEPAYSREEVEKIVEMARAEERTKAQEEAHHENQTEVKHAILGTYQDVLTDLRRDIEKFDQEIERNNQRLHLTLGAVRDAKKKHREMEDAALATLIRRDELESKLDEIQNLIAGM